MTSFLVLLWMTTKGDNQRIDLRKFSFSSVYIKAIISGGTPSITRQGIGSIAALTMNLVARGFGDAAIAGLSIVIRLSFIIIAAVIGFGHGYQPLCGFSYGAKLYNRVIKGFWFTVNVGTIFLLAVSVFGFIFAEELISLFRSDPDVVEIGSAAFRWQLATLFLLPFIMTSNMMMQTINKPLAANVLAASRRGLFYIPALLILPHFWGITGLEACQSVSDILSFFLTAPIMYYEIRKMRQS